MPDSNNNMFASIFSQQNEGLIHRPNPTDVLCGRGSGVYVFEGNQRFRKMVATRKKAYRDTHKHAVKSAIAVELYGRVHSLGGRFLEKVHPQPIAAGHANGTPVWRVAEKSVAMEKCKQSLREKDPEDVGTAQLDKKQQAKMGKSSPASSSSLSKEERQAFLMQQQLLASMPSSALVDLILSDASATLPLPAQDLPLQIHQQVLLSELMNPQAMAIPHQAPITTNYLDELMLQQLVPAASTNRAINVLALANMQQEQPHEAIFRHAHQLSHQAVTTDMAFVRQMELLQSLEAERQLVWSLLQHEQQDQVLLSTNVAGTKRPAVEENANTSRAAIPHKKRVKRLSQEETSDHSGNGIAALSEAASFISNSD